jgi:hypothetical protein
MTVRPALRLLSWFLAAGAAAAFAGWSWHRDGLWSAHTLGALTIALQVVAAASYHLLPAPCGVERAFARAAVLCEQRPAVMLVILLALFYALAWLTTPQIAFGGGYGHDGRVYGWMTEHFSWFRLKAAPPYNFRSLVPFLVHLSGLPTFTGYRVVNAASYALCGLFTYTIARHFGAARSRALVIVALVATVKMGLRFWLYYPVLMDGPGTALLLIVVFCTLARSRVGYLLAMGAAVFCRENLMPLMGFHVLHAIRTERALAPRLEAVALQAIPTGLYVASRVWPVFPPDRPFQTRIPNLFFFLLFLRPLDSVPVVLLAHTMTLGLLVVLPVLRVRAWLPQIWPRYEWRYFFFVTLFLTVATGFDIDRFTMWQLPLLIAAVACLPTLAAPGPRGWLWLHLMLLHAVSTQFLLPWAPSEAFYFGLSVFYSKASDRPAQFVSGTLTVVLTALLLRAARRAPASAVENERPPAPA